MNYTFEIDPTQVLTVSPNASLQEIRDAYRAKSKKYHPDQGGDEWAFRLVVRSYEILSRARVAGRLAGEESGPVASSAGASARVDPVRPSAGPDAEGASVRSGIRDQVDHPWRLADVELLLLRLEIDNPYDVISTPEAERNLSCSLNLTWPSAVAREDGAAPPSWAWELPAMVIEALDMTLTRTRAISTRQDITDDAVRGWLAYATARRASEAFTVLRQALNDRGLGVRQWTREIIVPRDRA